MLGHHAGVVAAPVGQAPAGQVWAAGAGPSEASCCETSPNGAIVHLSDVARVEIGAQDYTVNAYLNNEPATAIAMFQKPGSNALATSEAVEAALKRAEQELREAKHLDPAQYERLQNMVRYSGTQLAVKRRRR